MSEELFREALSAWGDKAQILMCIEELGELMHELLKALRGDENIALIAEEIADVCIMIEQMELLFECQEAVGLYILKKLQRLETRLKVDIR